MGADLPKLSSDNVLTSQNCLVEVLAHLGRFGGW
jgi:hypothetical protein